MVSVGIDLGYGDTKVIGVDGRREKFPSRWAKYDSKSWGFGGSILSLAVDDGDPFIFGENATGAGAREPLGDGRLSSADSLPLLAAALWISGAGDGGAQTSITLGSGTPLGTFDQEVAAARESLEGKTLTIKANNGQSRQIHIERLVVRPQGVGAALYLVEKGLVKSQPGYGLVIDVGSRTTDVLTINLMNMEPVVEMSFSIEAGIGDAVSNIGKLIARQTGFVVPTDVARQALTTPVMFKQRQVGGAEVGAPILKELSNRILDSLRANLRGELDRVTALIPVGGGAALIGQSLDVLAPGALVSAAPEDLQFANALGYRDAAERSK
ncbi:MAG: ParM/StbA family protein [Candidatus Thermoplasmatota archaeon]|jgi:actin-like ATPase involved in cell morphogenesis|nr:ParM/StbA family protein [Candidatus Thermoplasmatota archaeon]